jgi:hypothetical protein
MKKCKFFLLLFILILEEGTIVAQSTSSGPTFTNTPSGATDYLGWKSGTNRILLLKNVDDYEIQFWTNNGYRAKIGNSSGFGLSVGDGINTITNNIDIFCVGNGPPTEGYRYNGELILCTPLTSNIFLGVDAGSNTSTLENTFLGYKSGATNTSGDFNTYTGSMSGFNSNDGSNNSFTGAYAGYNNISGNHNVFGGAKHGPVLLLTRVQLLVTFITVIIRNVQIFKS